jgi:acyl dehydratase
MALNPALVGRQYPVSDPYVIGREKVREFATAIGDTNPVSHDVDAARALGYADVVAPPTFAFVITHKAMGEAMFDPDLGLDYSRVVHGEQRFTYVRPLVAGDVITVQATIDGIRSVAGNDMLTLRSDALDPTGTVVVSTTSVIVARGTADEESS